MGRRGRGRGGSAFERTRDVGREQEEPGCKKGGGRRGGPVLGGWSLEALDGEERVPVEDRKSLAAEDVARVEEWGQGNGARAWLRDGAELGCRQGCGLPSRQAVRAAGSRGPGPGTASGGAREGQGRGGGRSSFGQPGAPSSLGGAADRRWAPRPGLGYPASPGPKHGRLRDPSRQLGGGGGGGRGARVRGPSSRSRSCPHPRPGGAEKLGKEGKGRQERARAAAALTGSAAAPSSPSVAAAQPAAAQPAASTPHTAAAAATNAATGLATATATPPPGPPRGEEEAGKAVGEGDSDAPSANRSPLAGLPRGDWRCSGPIADVRGTRRALPRGLSHRPLSTPRCGYS
ncbi:uncharacterized protein [Notamacropus eugenii]|uniref:uncharacterized protein n=1 Tax=Notamacropus eugenii TaxID=9315 RepID=UPI003B67287A